MFDLLSSISSTLSSALSSTLSPATSDKLNMMCQISFDSYKFILQQLKHLKSYLHQFKTYFKLYNINFNYHKSWCALKYESRTGPVRSPAEIRQKPGRV